MTLDDQLSLEEFNRIKAKDMTRSENGKKGRSLGKFGEMSFARLFKYSKKNSECPELYDYITKYMSYSKMVEFLDYVNKREPFKRNDPYWK